MNNYNPIIREIIDISKKIKQMSGNSSEEELKKLTEQYEALSNKLNLNNNPNLKNLIDAESSIQEMIERKNYTYDELQSLIHKRDSYRVENGYVNYNDKDAEVEKTVNQDIKSNKNRNINKNKDPEPEKPNQRRKEIEESIKQDQEKKQQNHNTNGKDIDAEKKARLEYIKQEQQKEEQEKQRIKEQEQKLKEEQRLKEEKKFREEKQRIKQEEKRKQEEERIKEQRRQEVEESLKESQIKKEEDNKVNGAAKEEEKKARLEYIKQEQQKEEQEKKRKEEEKFKKEQERQEKEKIKQQNKEQQKEKIKEKKENIKENITTNQEKVKEKIQSEKLKEEQRLRNFFYDGDWYEKDSPIGRFINKRRKKREEKNIKKSSQRLQKEYDSIAQKAAQTKKYKSFINDYEAKQDILKTENANKFETSEIEEAKKFIEDPLNELKYKEALIGTSEFADSKEAQKRLSKIQSQKEKIETQRREEKIAQDKAFAKEYINTQKNNTELEEKLNETQGPITEEDFEKVNPQVLENKKNNEFLEENKDRFDNLNENIKNQVNDELFQEESSKIFKEKEAEFKENFGNDKAKLKGINKEIRTLKKNNNINKKINDLSKNKKNLSEEEYKKQLSEYQEQLKAHQEKLDELYKSKKEAKSNLKESRRKYLNREDPKTYEKEVNRLNKDLKTWDKLDTFHNAQQKFDAGDMAKEDFDALKNELFGEDEIVAPKRTRKEIEKEIERNKKLVKKFGGDVTKEAEEDIVDTFKNKLKNVSKFNLIFSGINAVSQYKDSRKDGHGVVGSVVRAGADFAISEMLGGKAYLAISLAKELPGAAIKGTEMLHTEVRKMNTASRFSVFGEAQFQDTDQLATMRQSGMEMAKMANYRLEQTLMGNEAKYLHK